MPRSVRGISFPRSPWECRLGRSASLPPEPFPPSARSDDAERQTAFPRGPWERAGLSVRARTG